jgi:WD40 repeat protein
VALLSEDSWVTGGEDGALALWNINKKKPVLVAQQAHGGPAHWVASVAAVKGSDLVASGSDDGYVRLWKAAVSSQALSQSSFEEVRAGAARAACACHEEATASPSLPLTPAPQHSIPLLHHGVLRCG